MHTTQAICTLQPDQMRTSFMNTSNIPAEPGMTISEIDTPALVIDLDVLEGNIKKMSRTCETYKVKLRPHAKTHKSVDIAHLQLNSGATGICCQKISEAEVFAAAGITDIFVTNELVGTKKLSRLIALAEKIEVRVCVDNRQNIKALSEYARLSGVDLQVMLEVNIGGGRCGVQPDQRAIDMTREIQNSPRLKFHGLQLYHGKAQHIHSFSERQKAITQSLATVETLLQRFTSSGIDCPVISGAGTGSYPFEAASGLYNELQCGSYVFMDRDYGSVMGESGPLLNTYENSLFVLTTIMSKPSVSTAVCDAGLKAHSIDSGMPSVHGRDSIEYRQAADEHGLLIDNQGTLDLGDKLLLIPGHCDPTVNLHEWYVCVREDRVEALWPVSARGMIF